MTTCSKNIHLNDEGTSIQFEITECIDGVDMIVGLTDAVTIEIKFDRGNDGAHILAVSGVIYTGGTNGDATDGIVHYVTNTGDMDTLGKMPAQVNITFASGLFHSSIDKSIKVVENL